MVLFIIIAGHINTIAQINYRNFVQSFTRADVNIFFNDQLTHCESTREHVATGHVPHGVANQIATAILEPTQDEHAYHQGWQCYQENSKDNENPYAPDDKDRFIQWHIKKYNEYNPVTQHELHEKWNDGWTSAYMVDYS